ncbi:MAG: T9SS type A sorting domain-containing protein [Ignavibacteriae bacterium]|nr:T9SS type A sorting domain-containing protein [Ignavibacteriota bacterium]
MKTFITSIIFFLSTQLSAQVITTIPEFPTQNDSIIVIYDATQGDAGLLGYTGEVYVHTGVNTTIDNWQHVIGNWGDDNSQPKLTRISMDLYKLDIGYPRDFYSVTNPSEKVLSLNFVFRSAGTDGATGRDVGGADIFLNLFEEGLNVKITQPDQGLNFVKVGSQINITATSNLSDSIKLFLDDILLTQTDGNEINHVLNITGNGARWLIATAQDSFNVVKDSTLLFVRSEPTILEPPIATIEGINYIDNSTVTLSLFAPGKDFIYIIGDFNNWQVDTNYQMNKTPDDSTFWLTINNLTPQTEYGFQYLVEGELTIADPYTEKTLDPNDKYISNSIYPNLKSYPTNKTTKIASILQTGQTEYNWINETFTKPEKTDLVIYEMWLRNFIELHNYQTLIDTLDYLDNLGINVIELMPVNEFEGNDSWGYNPSFYFAVDKNYGASKDLKRFIDECHSRGIAVIIDMVLNHSFAQNPMVQLYFDKYANNEIVSHPNSPWYNVSSPNRSFYWGADFNHESPYTKKFIDRVNTYWLSEFKIDGFRFDFTKGFTNKAGDGWAYDESRIAILKRMSDVIWSVDSAAYVILEHLADNSEEKVLADYGIMLWGNMNHNYNEATMGYTETGKSDLSWGYYKNRNWLMPNLVTYMESHDEERLMYKNLQWGNSNGNYSIKNLSTALSRIKLASAFFYTIPGPKMIWQFAEIGFDYSINWPSGENKDRLTLKPFVWNYLQDTDRLNLYKTTQALIKLRLENEVFRSENVILNLSGDVKRIKIADKSMNVVIIGNFNVIEKSIIPSFHNEGIWYDYFSGDSIEVTNTQLSVALSPGEFHIYTTKKLQTPESGILVNVEKNNDNSIPTAFKLYQNYPNPFNPTTTISYNLPSRNNNGKLENVKLKVFDIIGNEVATLVNKKQSPGNYNINFDASFLPSGIYFYRLQTGSFVETKKLVLLK